MGVDAETERKHNKMLKPDGNEQCFGKQKLTLVKLYCCVFLRRFCIQSLNLVSKIGRTITIFKYVSGRKPCYWLKLVALQMLELAVCKRNGIETEQTFPYDIN